MSRWLLWCLIVTREPIEQNRRNCYRSTNVWWNMRRRTSVCCILVNRTYRDPHTGGASSRTSTHRLHLGGLIMNLLTSQRHCSRLQKQKPIVYFTLPYISTLTFRDRFRGDFQKKFKIEPHFMVHSLWWFVHCNKTSSYFENRCNFLNDTFMYYITLKKLPFYIRITNYLISTGRKRIAVSVCKYST